MIDDMNENILNEYFCKNQKNIFIKLLIFSESRYKAISLIILICPDHDIDYCLSFKETHLFIRIVFNVYDLFLST